MPRIPAASSERLANAPLKSIIGQVRFSQLPELSDGATIGRIHGPLAEVYPRLLQENQANIAVGPAGVQTQVGAVWRMTDLNAIWSVVIGPDFMGLETASYTDWSDFESRLDTALSALASHAPVRIRERMGLRYVNEFRDEGVEVAMDWSSRLRPSLLGLIADEAIGSVPLSHSVTELRLQLPSGTMAIRHGAIHQAGPGAQLPFYLLDVDCFDERPTTFDLQATLQEFAEYNDVAWRLFRWCVTDAYYRRLKGTA